ncbi:MAG: hypothetical protein U0V75_12870 [Ferruginibacter sp.]
MKRTVFSAVIITASILLLASCNSTRLTSAWKAPEAGTAHFNKILVIGITGNKERELRTAIENALVKQLSSQGVTAASSMEQFGPKSFRSLNEEQAVKMVNDNGFDGVIVVALLDKKKDRNYTPGYVTSTPYTVIRNRWHGNYSVLYDRVYTPGYYSTTTDYTLEASFYKTRGDKLLYSAEAKSFDPNSPKDLAGDFSKKLVKDMMQKDVIRK